MRRIEVGNDIRCNKGIGQKVLQIMWDTAIDSLLSESSSRESNVHQNSPSAYLQEAKWFERL